MVIAGVNVDHQHLIDLTNEYFFKKPPVWHKGGEKSASPDRSIAQYTGGFIKVHLTFLYFPQGAPNLLVYQRKRERKCFMLEREGVFVSKRFRCPGLKLAYCKFTVPWTYLDYSGACRV